MSLVLQLPFRRVRNIRHSKSTMILAKMFHGVQLQLHHRMLPPGAAPSHGPKRARKDNRPERASPWGSQQASSSSQQPEQEQEPVATWVEVPFPEGTVEHTFVFGKENMTLCRGKIIHAESDPNHLPPAYDKNAEVRTQHGRWNRPYRALRPKGCHVSCEIAVCDPEH